MHAIANRPAIELTQLRKTFHPRGQAPVHAVAGVDLTIGAGEVVALLGPNGAGKSSMLDVIVGLSEPTDGTATVLGLPPRRAVHAGQVSAMLQSGGLLGDLTVAETVRMIASLFPRHAPVGEVLDRAGLTPLAARRVAVCSDGERQRLRFALALLPDPDVVVLDEPTTGMDVAGRRDFWAAMGHDAAAGRTVLFATHYLAEAEAFADRIVVMAAGKVVADGTREAIRRHASGGADATFDDAVLTLIDGSAGTLG